MIQMIDYCLIAPSRLPTRMDWTCKDCTAVRAVGFYPEQIWIIFKWDRGAPVILIPQQVGVFRLIGWGDSNQFVMMLMFATNYQDWNVHTVQQLHWNSLSSFPRLATQETLIHVIIYQDIASPPTSPPYPHQVWQVPTDTQPYIQHLWSWGWWRSRWSDWCWWRSCWWDCLQIII